MDPAGQPSEPPKGRRPLRVGATGGRPISPLHPAETHPSLPEEGQPGRCFLPRRSLPPGHNLGIPEMSNAMGPPAEPRVYLNEITPDWMGT